MRSPGQPVGGVPWAFPLRKELGRAKKGDVCGGKRHLHLSNAIVSRYHTERVGCGRRECERRRARAIALAPYERARRRKTSMPHGSHEMKRPPRRLPVVGSALPRRPRSRTGKIPLTSTMMILRSRTRGGRSRVIFDCDFAHSDAPEVCKWRGQRRDHLRGVNDGFAVSFG